MALGYLDDSKLYAIASAIRAKTGDSSTMTVDDMPDEIVSISTGAQVEPLSVTENGTYTASAGYAYSPVTVDVAGGGDGGSISDPIRFFDYDGTLIASYASAPASLPSVPSHDGLDEGAWNYTLAQIASEFSTMGVCDVGANYKTTSGCTEIDITLSDGRKSPYLQLAVEGQVQIRWGDGSSSSMAGDSLAVAQSVNHVYASPGSYTITIVQVSGTHSIFCTSTVTLLHNNGSSNASNRVYASCVTEVRLGPSARIGDYAFWCCSNLKSVSIPQETLTNIGRSAFGYCSNLRFAAIPSGVTRINDNTFQGCDSLRAVSLPVSVTELGGNIFSASASIASIVMPSTITSIGVSLFNSDNSLTKVRLPKSLVSLGDFAFNNCYSLSSITIPSSVTTLGTGMFNQCYGVAEYHVLPTSPPVMAGDSWNGIASDCVIYVPSESLSAYQSAQYWRAHASRMVGE